MTIPSPTPKCHREKVKAINKFNPKKSSKARLPAAAETKHLTLFCDTSVAQTPHPDGSKRDNGELDPGEKEVTETVLVENCPGANWPQWSQPGSLAQNTMGLLRWGFGDVGRWRQKVARAGLQNARFCGHDEHFTRGAL